MPIILRSIILIILLSTTSYSDELNKIGTFKDWDAIIVTNDGNKVCFAQSKPVLQSPKKNDRDARLFVTFRPSEKITDEVSTTSGYEYNSQNSITATSGKTKYKFDIAQDNFAWISNNKIEKSEMEKIVLVDVPSQIYGELRRVFINLFENSGFKDVKINENVDFKKLYEMKKTQ